ncbi:GDSL-type esterase/lipase family protein [Halalkalibacter alkaliphilus]|uniref:GDSL-type esterase/lipase family protein n=1 Tax=Halalkalibacter alkaliphilus TaxID=2917993 RepID=A0A9X2CWT2_9BACI|nr:GDSL-type esterase/lipase family protein [Halalkalibacter alkaliphilus]MCL7749219.1 GDSL-type esterase/lipase family protein [Halalkalibacter alkaliphilus]
MRTLFKSFTLLLIITLLSATTAFAKDDHAKKSLVSLGDSIPYGYNLGNNNNASPSKHAFPYLIGEDADMRVRNLAVSGWTTDQMLSALKHDQKYRQAVRHADYVTLTIGNNDLLQALAKAGELSEGDQNLFLYHLNDQIEKSGVFGKITANIVQIRSLTDAPIVVYNVYNPFQVNDPLHQTGLFVLPGINEQLDLLIASLNFHYKNIAIADAFNAFGTNQAQYVIAGDIHPTVDGQRKLAEVGLETLNHFMK